MKEYDRILLYGLKFYGHHGFYPEERNLGQWFEVDLDIWGDFSTAAQSDNLEDALDYGKVYREVKKVLEGPPVKLLESLAWRVKDGILAWPQVRKVRVCIRKPQAPLGGLLSFAGVEMTGCKDED